MAPKREIQFKMLLTASEQAMLRELADRKGLTASDYLRTMIREQHDQQNDLSAPFADLAKQLKRVGGRAAGKELREFAKELRGVSPKKPKPKK